MINANGIHTTSPSTALQPGGNFILFCLFVCLFVVIVQFYKNRENSYLDSGYQIARLHARGLMENLVPSLLSLPRLGCLGYFSARWLVGSIVKD